jgi:hypothetical protein
MLCMLLSNTGYLRVGLIMDFSLWKMDIEMKTRKEGIWEIHFRYYKLQGNFILLSEHSEIILLFSSTLYLELYTRQKTYGSAQ